MIPEFFCDCLKNKNYFDSFLKNENCLDDYFKCFIEHNKSMNDEQISKILIMFSRYSDKLKIFDYLSLTKEINTSFFFFYSLFISANKRLTSSNIFVCFVYKNNFNKFFIDYNVHPFIDFYNMDTIYYCGKNEHNKTKMDLLTISYCDNLKNIIYDPSEFFDTIFSYCKFLTNSQIPLGKNIYFDFFHYLNKGNYEKCVNMLENTEIHKFSFFLIKILISKNIKSTIELLKLCLKPYDLIGNNYTDNRTYLLSLLPRTNKKIKKDFCDLNLFDWETANYLLIADNNKCISIKYLVNKMIFNDNFRYIINYLFVKKKYSYIEKIMIYKNIELSYFDLDMTCKILFCIFLLGKNSSLLKDNDLYNMDWCTILDYSSVNDLSIFKLCYVIKIFENSIYFKYGFSDELKKKIIFITDKMNDEVIVNFVKIIYSMQNLNIITKIDNIKFIYQYIKQTKKNFVDEIDYHSINYINIFILEDYDILKILVDKYKFILNFEKIMEIKLQLVVTIHAIISILKKNQIKFIICPTIKNTDENCIICKNTVNIYKLCLNNHVICDEDFEYYTEKQTIVKKCPYCNSFFQDMIFENKK